MVASRDIDSLLQTGAWTTSHAKSPIRSFDSTSRANSSSKLVRSKLPRSFHLDLNRGHFPPPPSVEDEADSLAREHGSPVGVSSDEDPKFPGDIEQFPIIQDVAENNLERRFVLVAGSGDDGDGAKGAKGAPRDDCEANTCRKYVVVGSEQKTRPQSARQRSRQDLPPLETDLGNRKEPPLRRVGSRGHGLVEVTQEQQQPHESLGRSDERPLLPMIQTSAKGRDRAYWNFSSEARTSTASLQPDDPRRDRRQRDVCLGRSASTRGKSLLSQRRTSSAVDPPHVERDLSVRQPRRDIEREQQLYRSDTRMPPFRRSDSSSKSSYRVRGERQSTSPPYTSSKRDAMRRSFRKQTPYPDSTDEDGNSSDEYVRSQKSDRSRTQLRRSPVGQEDAGALLTPGGYRETPRRNGSRMTTPTVSPRASRGEGFPDFELGHSPRSATFSSESRKRRDGDVEPHSSASLAEVDMVALSSRSRARYRSSAANPSAQPVMPFPVSTHAVEMSPVERRPSALPLQTRQNSSTELGFLSAPPFLEARDGRGSYAPIKSFRQYSEDVRRGILPSLFDCPRKQPVVGFHDWLTIPRTENFDICTGCFQHFFSHSEHQHVFAQAKRPLDRPVACAFGRSWWYHIAYVVTLKLQLPDLRLIQTMATVLAQRQACASSLPVTRNWYSIKDPHSKRAISNFAVCHGCANAVEVLFPNLTGTFMPLGPPELDVCQLYYHPARRRFFEYFDMLERTSDRARSRQRPPDLQDLANRVREISLVDECCGNQFIENRKWHVLERFPGFTVCDECFEQVVHPVLEDLGGTESIADNFFSRRRYRPVASCQLYSDYMRSIFRKACAANDWDYLLEKAMERLDREKDLRRQPAEVTGKEAAGVELREAIVRE